MGNNANKPTHVLPSGSSSSSSLSSPSTSDADLTDRNRSSPRRRGPSSGGSRGEVGGLDSASSGYKEPIMTMPSHVLEKEIEAKLESAKKTYALDLQGCGLRAVPKGVFALKELASLNLSNNNLAALEEAIVRDLPALTSLRVNGNKLTGLPSLCAAGSCVIMPASSDGGEGEGESGDNGNISTPRSGLEALEVLDIGKNRLRSLPRSMKMLRSLMRLVAHCNLLDELPPEIGQLEQLTVLDLSTNNLRHLPPEVGLLRNLKSLDIDNNRLQDLPAEFAQLSSLTQLTCSNNLFTDLPEAICRLGSAATLKILNFSCNRLSQLPASMGLLADSLTEFDLSCNRFVAFPDSLADCRSLITLNLHDNKLRTISSSIARLGELATLDLAHNKLTTMPPELGAMTVLMELDLSYNKLVALPPELGQLSFLGKLSLRHNALFPTLPTEISNLGCVQELDLSHNGLTDLPVELFQLDKLQTLKLDSNSLTSLPPELGRLYRLNHLHVANNRLTGLPDELAQLTRLQVLSLYQNAITKLPEGLGTLKNLEMICLGDNLLDEAGVNAILTSEKTNLSSLEQLILSGNKFQSIPEALCNLHTLKELYLSRNQILEIPSAFTKLQKIRILDLADNAISSLPPFISSLHSLREINLSYNRLSSLPPDFVKLTNLCVLYLMHNNLTELPQEIQAMRSGNCYHMDLEDNLIPNLTSLLADTKKKKRKRSTSKQETEKLNKSKRDKSRVAGISEMMGKRPHMEDTVSSHLAFSGIDGDDFFAVFDGHAGRASAVFAADHFHWVLARKVMEERESGLGITSKRGSPRGKTKGKEKGSFWNISRRAKTKDQARQRIKQGIDAGVPNRTDSAGQQDYGKRTEHAPVEINKSNHDSKEKDKSREDEEEADSSYERLPQTGIDEADDPDSEEEVINFPKDVDSNSGKEAQAAFSALIKSFLEMDELMKENRDGATAVVTLASKRLHKLFVANVGDARAVLCRRGKAFPLTIDHTPKLLAESERIRALQGFVTSNRVNGVIAISRSLGDASMKPYVSAEPGTCVVNLCPEDQFLILACDGCWDTVDNQMAVDIVSSELAISGNPARAAIKLKDQAFWRGSGDNISVIVVILDRYLPSERSSSSVTSSSSSLGGEDERRMRATSSHATRGNSAKQKKIETIERTSPKSSESDPNLPLKHRMENNNPTIGSKRSLSDAMVSSGPTATFHQSPQMQGSSHERGTDASVAESTGVAAKGKKSKRTAKEIETDTTAARKTENVQNEKGLKKEKGHKKMKKEKKASDQRSESNKNLKKEKKKKKKKSKDGRARTRSRSVADAEESPQYGRNRALSAEKDITRRSSRSSSVAEESVIGARKFSKDSLTGDPISGNVTTLSSGDLHGALVGSRHRNTTRTERSGSLGK